MKMTIFLLVTTNKQPLWNRMKIRRVGLPGPTVGQYTWNLGVLVKKNMLGSHWHIGNEKDTVLTATEGWTLGPHVG